MGYLGVAPASACHFGANPFVRATAPGRPPSRPQMNAGLRSGEPASTFGHQRCCAAATYTAGTMLGSPGPVVPR